VRVCATHRLQLEERGRRAQLWCAGPPAHQPEVWLVLDVVADVVIGAATTYELATVRALRILQLQLEAIDVFRELAGRRSAYRVERRRAA
jgi:hypothetical protein